MLNKLRLFLWLLAAAFLAGLLTISIYVKLMDCEDLLLVTPASANSSEISAEELEKINGTSFLLTYEILSKENLQALNANYDVTIRKTNYSYPFIAEIKLINGSFFTEQDQKEKKKTVVLNKTAACSMFGNTDICGRKIKMDQNEYTVTGVVDDKEKKENNVYLPAACFEENPSSFALKLEGNLTGGYVKNKCKMVAPEGSGYNFVPFKTLTDLIYGILFIGLKFALIGIILFLLSKSHSRFREGVNEIRNLSERFYTRDLLQHHRGDVLKAALALIGMILMAVLILNLSFSFTGYYLHWHENELLLQISDSSTFGRIASTLIKDLYLSLFFLAGFMISIVLLMLSGFCKTSEKTEHQ